MNTKLDQNERETEDLSYLLLLQDVYVFAVYLSQTVKRQLVGSSRVMNWKKKDEERSCHGLICGVIRALALGKPRKPWIRIVSPGRVPAFLTGIFRTRYLECQNIAEDIPKNKWDSMTEHGILTMSCHFVSCHVISWNVHRNAKLLSKKTERDRRRWW